MNIVSPSILGADFANLGRDIERVKNAQWLHVDVMDGHFVPNISVGVPVVQSIRAVTNLFLDVHLMISDPAAFIEAFAKAGADMICFHAETSVDAGAVIQTIKQLGKKVGLALKPATDAAAVFPFLDEIDMVLVMTVEPGFGGQAFMPEMLEKIKAVRQEAVRRNCSLDIQVDGGINFDTAKLCTTAGANVFVAGSFVFGNENPAQIVEQLKAITG